MYLSHPFHSFVQLFLYLPKTNIKSAHNEYIFGTSIFLHVTFRQINFDIYIFCPRATIQKECTPFPPRYRPYCKTRLAVGALYMIPRFSFMPRTAIRIISHLHLSNKQVFKHSLKMPGDTSGLESKKESRRISLLRRHKGTYPSFS